MISLKPILLRRITLLAGAVTILSLTLPNHYSSTLASAHASAQDSGGEKRGDEEKNPDDEAANEAETLLTEAIQEKLEELTAGSATYDGKTFKVVYSEKDPDALRTDCEWAGKGEARNIEFRNGYRFAGHTEGHILFKPRFKGDVTFEATITYQWIERKSHFMMLVHASEREFYGSEFGVHAVTKVGKKKLRMKGSKQKRFQKDASQWVDRTAEHRQVVRVTSKNLEVTQDGVGAELDLGKDPLEGGRVGFLWDGVKFNITKMTITGELDREWAAKRVGYRPK